MATRGVAGLVIAGIFMSLYWPRAAAIAGTISGLSLLVALVGPAALIRRLHGLLAWLEKATGAVVTVLVLGALYLVFLTPAGLFLRGKPGRRFRARYEQAATTYWTRRSAPPSDTERQF